MQSVGVRDFKERASEILRRVREEQIPYEITYHGRAIARIVPVEAPARPHESLDEFWSEWEALAQDIGSRWPAGVSAVDAIREDRSRTE